jgi:dihydroorotate dehydrogenase (fumarate)
MPPITFAPVSGRCLSLAEREEIAILHGRIAASLAASTGVHTFEDVVRVLLVGADVAMMTSALLRHGPLHLTRVEAGLESWLSDRGHAGVHEIRGTMSQRAIPDPGAFERANYMRNITAYSSRIRA